MSQRILSLKTLPLSSFSVYQIFNTNKPLTSQLQLVSTINKIPYSEHAKSLLVEELLISLPLIDPYPLPINNIYYFSVLLEPETKINNSSSLQHVDESIGIVHSPQLPTTNSYSTIKTAPSLLNNYKSMLLISILHHILMIDIRLLLQKN